MGDVAALDVGLDRDVFLRELVGQLVGTLEDVVGLDQAEGYVSVVGRAIGAMLDRRYRSAMGADRLDTESIAAVLVDLKRRIEGGFRIASVEGGRIVLVNAACPFGDRVIGRPSLCMMTMNVFGTIAAENAGFARVAIPEAIATGAAGCRVVIDLDPDSETDCDGDPDAVGGARGGVHGAREFFRTGA